MTNDNSLSFYRLLDSLTNHCSDLFLYPNPITYPPLVVSIIIMNYNLCLWTLFGLVIVLKQNSCDFKVGCVNDLCLPKVLELVQEIVTSE